VNSTSNDKRRTLSAGVLVVEKIEVGELKHMPKEQTLEYKAVNPPTLI
jgi:hypothetical protein